MKTKFTGAGPHLVLVRPKSFAAEPSGGGAAAVEALAVPDLGATGARQDQAAATSRRPPGPKLDEAAIVVSGGRGLGEAAKYEMVEQLAKLLKGAPGASRAIVDAGWVPYSLPGRPDRQGREADASTSPPASPAPPSTWSA